MTIQRTSWTPQREKSRYKCDHESEFPREEVSATDEDSLFLLENYVVRLRSPAATRRSVELVRRRGAVDELVDRGRATTGEYAVNGRTFKIDVTAFSFAQWIKTGSHV